VRSAGELITLVREIDPPAAKLLEERAQAFLPALLVNQVRSAEQRQIGPELVAAWRDRLGIPVAYAGSVDTDPNVLASVAQRLPALLAFPRCSFSKHIDALAQGLLREQGEAPRERAEERRPVTRAAAPATRQRGPLPALDPSQPGAYLRRCREHLGLGLDEMIERTRIRILDQIESERFEQLPPEPYLRGFLFSYAQELGVPDVAGFAASYLKRLQSAAG
jgi:hypothetical protein